MTHIDVPIETQQKLDRAISEYFDSEVKFGFLRFGPLCNASESNAFTSARCNITHIKTPKQNKHYCLEFKKLFARGVKLLNRYKLRSPAQNSTAKTEAIQKLETFFKEKGKDYAHIKLLFKYVQFKNKKDLQNLRM